MTKFGADDPDLAAEVLRLHAAAGAVPADDETRAMIREMLDLPGPKPPTAREGYLAVLKVAGVALTIIAVLAFAAGIVAHAFMLGWGLV